jgi:hypothetical protein
LFFVVRTHQFAFIQIPKKVAVTPIRSFVLMVLEIQFFWAAA